jgi:glycosyltransferase involved in cell wall biosynthesis
VSNGPLEILQISTADRLGGAEAIALGLHRAYRARRHHATLGVGRKTGCEPGVMHIRQDVGHPWKRLWWGLHHGLQPSYGRTRGARSLLRACQRLAEPAGLWDTLRGIEDFRYPGTHHLLELTDRMPDVVHCHNLHGKYFDLRALPYLSRQTPLVLTMHDAWLMTGHCAHSFDCERWKTGCGQCPDLGIYPPIRRDATAGNRQRKRDIYAKSRLFVATPCRWLMEQVEQSILRPAVVDARVIPNGVDRSIFRPEDKTAARHALGLPLKADILLFAAKGIRDNRWKDFPTLRQALNTLARRSTDRRLVFVALGEAAPAERIGDTELRFVKFQQDARTVARHYQAADLYVHAARVDTFPNTILEALACGVPVVATAVGGIPEQIRSLANGTTTKGLPNGYDAENATGALVPAGDAEALALQIGRLLDDDVLRMRLADNAARDAADRFDHIDQADAYIDWFRAIRAGNAGDRTCAYQESDPGVIRSAHVRGLALIE